MPHDHQPATITDCRDLLTNCGALLTVVSRSLTSFEESQIRTMGECHILELVGDQLVEIDKLLAKVCANKKR